MCHIYICLTFNEYTSKLCSSLLLLVAKVVVQEAEGGSILGFKAEEIKT